MLLDLNSKGQHQVKGKEKESRSLVFTSSRKPCAVSRRSCALTSKRCTKKGDVFFCCQSKPIVFLPFSLPSLSFLLKQKWCFVKSPLNAELCGSKFYHAQQYPSIPITIRFACFFWSEIKNEIYYSFIALLSLLIKRWYLTIILMNEAEHLMKNYGDRGGCYGRGG